jgi:colicin import membrane protein
MPSASDRIVFGPPGNTGAVRSFGLALLVHALLFAALTWGVNWKRSDQSPAFEAEIWSNVAQEAAPKLVEPRPTPTPAPLATKPPPEPLAKMPEPKATPPAPDVDIALEQEKKRKLLKQREREQEQRQQREAEAEKLLAKQKAESLAKKEKELKAKEELAKRKTLEDAKKVEAKKQENNEKMSAAALEQQRKQNIARAMGLAGATGGETAKGTALQARGPSGSYGGKVRAKVKPNVIFTDDIQGNPEAEVEVRSLPDGTIMSQRLVKSSGNKAWDDAVVKAIIRTETMPRDVDGRVPTPMILSFTPKDLAR